jgi:hypothetical protein
VRYFATVFPLMHVQGNQNVPICLEEKQFCTETEQRKQLAREVLPAFDANAAETRRGRLLHGMSLRSSSSIVWRKERTAGTFSGNSTESTQGALETHDQLRACSRDHHFQREATAAKNIYPVTVVLMGQRLPHCPSISFPRSPIASLWSVHA